MDLQNWVNEGLMTLFFLVVALEVKREVTTGELRDPRTAALPVIAAIGGMVVPAGMYLLLNAGSDTAGGWGVPVATDIAFALGILTLAASRAPVSLRSFLLTLAIVDDIGAILLIAIFYSGGLAPGWLAVATAIIGSVVPRATRPRDIACALPPARGGALDRALRVGSPPDARGSCPRADYTGRPLRRSATAGSEARETLREVDDEPDERAEAYWIAVDDMAKTAVSPLDRVERSLHPWTSGIVVPTFALANAGIELSEAAFSEAVTSPLGLGVLLGLVVGKPLGIGAAVMAGTRIRIGRLPSGHSPHDRRSRSPCGSRLHGRPLYRGAGVRRAE